LPQVVLGDFQLEHQGVGLGDLVDLDLLGVVDQPARQVVDQLAQGGLTRFAVGVVGHEPGQAAGAAAFFWRRSSSETVWLGNAPTFSQCWTRCSSTRNSTGSRIGS